MRPSKFKKSPVLWASVGLGLSGEILVLGWAGFWFGQKLDLHFGLRYVFTLGLLFLGMSLAFWHLWVVLRRLNSEE